YDDIMILLVDSWNSLSSLASIIMAQFGHDRPCCELRRGLLRLLQQATYHSRGVQNGFPIDHPSCLVDRSGFELLRCKDGGHVRINVGILSLESLLSPRGLVFRKREEEVIQDETLKEICYVGKNKSIGQRTAKQKVKVLLSRKSRYCQSKIEEVKKLQNQGVNIFDYIRIKIENGDNTSFWKDKWHNEGVLKDVFPCLYALARHQNVTIHTKLNDYSLVNSFRRNPRSGVEEFQLDNLSRLVSTITLSSAVDRYVWSLENSGEFSVKSIRQVIDANCFPVIHSATRWVKSVPLKVNIMAWKIKMDGLPTRMNISRRGIEIDSIVCPICNSGAESSCHIFFQCNLVRQLARKISSWWNVDYVDVSSYEEWYTWLVSLRLQANLKAVRGFLITLFLILIIGDALEIDTDLPATVAVMCLTLLIVLDLADVQNCSTNVVDTTGLTVRA
ncbi:RNA-directed DNA polymerase, eukaryota, partial [Tanacetum coccineum]